MYQFDDNLVTTRDFSPFLPYSKVNRTTIVENNKGGILYGVSTVSIMDKVLKKIKSYWIICLVFLFFLSYYLPPPKISPITGTLLNGFPLSCCDWFWL